MFLDEARLSMVLTHANIVQVFDVGRADGTYFIVMEFVDGHNLRRVFQRMSERGIRMPVHYAAYIVMEICKGLAHAHDQRNTEGGLLGIVHRDISPPNILISKAGEVKITDFGLAKAVTQLELTDPGIVKGKFSYLSPEAANGKDVDHRADLFSVGVLLWEVLSGRRLFLGKSDMETVEMVRTAEIPALSTFNQDVSAEFGAIVEKALARDPRQRWHSARDLGDELARYLFANNLKVTSYDIAGMVAELFSENGNAESPTEQRIGMLIDEEVLNLSMLGMIGQGMRADGAKPLNDAEILNVPEASVRLSVADIWQVPSLEGLSEDITLADELNEYVATHAPVERSSVTHSSVISAMGQLPEKLEKVQMEASEASKRAPETRGKWPVVVVSLVVLASIAAGLYFAGVFDTWL